MCSARISSVSTLPAARAASTLDVTRSTTSRIQPPGAIPSSSAARVMAQDHHQRAAQHLHPILDAAHHSGPIT
nr:hypothetical protein [Actinomadura sp. OS1-43]